MIVTAYDVLKLNNYKGVFKLNKFVTDLTKEELNIVFSNNDKLQNNVLNDMIDSEMFWISEQLDYVRNHLSNWSVGTGAPVFLNVMQGHEREFVEGVIKIQQTYSLLHDDENSFIAAIAEMIEQYYETESYSDEYYKLQNEVQQHVNLLAEKIEKQFKDALDGCYNHDEQLRYFKEFYLQERLNPSAYIVLENNDYKLYEDVSYTKNYG